MMKPILFDFPLPIKKSFLPDEKDMPLLEETINNAYEKGYVTDNV